MTDLPKLIRDKIPEIIRESGDRPVTREVSDEEIEKWLRKKVLEEAKEFEEDGAIEELADLYAVVERYLEVEDTSFSKLERLEEDKSSERGGFKDNIVLEDVE